MKERPILFSAPMVRALLDGTKTQTRRAVKPQPSAHTTGFLTGLEGDFLTHWPTNGGDYTGAGIVCPYGKPGDRLWVRESFADLAGTGIDHRPDPRGPMQRYAFAANTKPGSHGDEARIAYGIKWKPSIHMPRAACRIELEITDVRVQRLQECSAPDAWAEGIPHSPDVNPVHEYEELWNSINGAGAWDANPWVWALTFKRVAAR